MVTGGFDIDLRQVRSFVAVAEEGNVTRAARRLHLAQQALSAQILRLERRVGVRLFDRVPSGMRLTPAGEAFLVESRKTLAQALRAVEAAVHAERPVDAPTLTVAFKAQATAHFTGPLIAALAERAARIEVELHSVSTLGEELAALDDGIADAAFAWLPIGADGLRHEAILDEPWVAALAPAHRLAEREEVSIGELAEDPVVGPHDTLPAVVTAAWTVDPRPDGRPAPRGPVARTPEECLQHVAAGRAIWLAPESVSGYFVRPKVAWVPITDIARAQLAVVFRPERDGAELRALIEHARVAAWDRPLRAPGGDRDAGRRRS